jgi:hypothetical protein
MAGAAIGGGAAAAIGCDDARCRSAGVAAGVAVLVGALIVLLVSP